MSKEEFYGVLINPIGEKLTQLRGFRFYDEKIKREVGEFSLVVGDPIDLGLNEFRIGRMRSGIVNVTEFDIEKNTGVFVLEGKWFGQ